MAFAEDLSLFLDADEHAVTVTLDGVQVTGIFERPYLEVAGMASTGPAFRCATAAAIGTVQGDTLVFNGDTYEVASVQPDGTGLTRLLLELAS